MRDVLSARAEEECPGDPAAQNSLLQDEEGRRELFLGAYEREQTLLLRLFGSETDCSLPSFFDPDQLRTLVATAERASEAALAKTSTASTRTETETDVQILEGDRSDSPVSMDPETPTPTRFGFGVIEEEREKEEREEEEGKS